MIYNNLKNASKIADRIAKEKSKDIYVVLDTDDNGDYGYTLTDEEGVNTLYTFHRIDYIAEAC